MTSKIIFFKFQFGEPRIDRKGPGAEEIQDPGKCSQWKYYDTRKDYENDIVSFQLSVLKFWNYIILSFYNLLLSEAYSEHSQINTPYIITTVCYNTHHCTIYNVLSIGLSVVE